MNKRENLLKLLKRQGFGEVPCEFMLCPDLVKLYEEKIQSPLEYYDYFEMPWRRVSELFPSDMSVDKYQKYYKNLKPDTEIDYWGVAHERGSEAAKHMTYMRHPLKGIDDFEIIKEYPFPDFSKVSNEVQKKDVEELHKKGIASVGNMQMTIWETAWSIRGMEDLMMDMMSEEESADFVLDKVLDVSLTKAKLYAEAGVDILFIGDDVGMQNSLMMSENLYVDWLKPRLKKIITEVKKINPNILVFYHSCGTVTQLIPHFIEAGIDVLNPIQSECMDFERIFNEFKGQVSFHGTIGTQKIMPFGTAEDVRNEVFRNLKIAGDKGGLFVAPTHLLEPEVPWENIIAYVQACKDYAK